jgi:hypothetical protein
VWRHALSLLILLLATVLFPWSFETQVKTITIPVFSNILSARTTHSKHSPSIVAWRRPHRKHVSRVRLRVDLSVSSTGRGADDIENTASSTVACWTGFPELMPGTSWSNPLQTQKVAIREREKKRGNFNDILYVVLMKINKKYHCRAFI